MTLLDRFRAPSRHKHPDPAVRLAYVEEIPLADRDAIAEIAREDEEPRVRRAAVSKLMDPKALASILREDADESVRGTASAMLRDIALEAFEGLTEDDSIEAVDGLTDVRLLAHIAKGTARKRVALQALSRVRDAHALGSVARHASSEDARLSALDALRERCEHDEILAVAMNGEYKDSALLAAGMVTDQGELEQVAARARNRSVAKYARGVLRGADDKTPHETTTNGSVTTVSTHDGEFPDMAGVAQAAWHETDRGSAGVPAAIESPPSGVEEAAALQVGEQEITGTAVLQEPDAAVLQETEPAIVHAIDAGVSLPVDEATHRECERRRARLAELADLLTQATADPDVAAARRALDVARGEWAEISVGAAVDPTVAMQFADAEARITARPAESQDADLRVRREALARIRHLIDRVEPLLAMPDLTLAAGTRALRNIRAALSPLPPLPTRQDAEEATRRLKALQAGLGPLVQELRATDEWQRWSNVAVQEQLIAKMEALLGLDDPDAIAREVRALQQQWRQVANVPRAQADVLWRRFKGAHDAVWPRCEEHFAAQAQIRAENLAKKNALCERAEALAESTHWIQTAEEIKRLQGDWKTLGPVSRGSEKAVWDRFRAACDHFFTRRQADLAERKKSWAENLAKKEALSARAEALADSTDWDHAAAELKRLQAEWRAVGPVKKTRSEAIWRRFHDACNRFFTRHAQRHDIARAERVASRETICAELESLAPEGEDDVSSEGQPSDLLSKLRDVRTRWQRETAARGVDPDHARALDERFTAAFSRVVSRWPAGFTGTEFDVDANRRAMESLVKRMETLATSLAAPADGSSDVSDALSPTTRLAAMLKEALAANTIGGKADDNANKRAAADDVRQAQAAWARLGFVPEDLRRSLTERFRRACRQITERVDEGGAMGRSDGFRASAAPNRASDRRRTDARVPDARRAAEASEAG